MNPLSLQIISLNAVIHKTIGKTFWKIQQHGKKKDKSLRRKIYETESYAEFKRYWKDINPIFTDIVYKALVGDDEHKDYYRFPNGIFGMYLTFDSLYVSQTYDEVEDVNFSTWLLFLDENGSVNQLTLPSQAMDIGWDFIKFLSKAENPPLFEELKIVQSNSGELDAAFANIGKYIKRLDLGEEYFNGFDCLDFSLRNVPNLEELRITYGSDWKNQLIYEHDKAFIKVLEQSQNMKKFILNSSLDLGFTFGTLLEEIKQVSSLETMCFTGEFATASTFKITKEKECENFKKYFPKLRFQGNIKLGWFSDIKEMSPIICGRIESAYMRMKTREFPLALAKLSELKQAKIYFSAHGTVETLPRNLSELNMKNLVELTMIGCTVDLQVFFWIFSGSSNLKELRSVKHKHLPKNKNSLTEEDLVKLLTDNENYMSKIEIFDIEAYGHRYSGEKIRANRVGDLIFNRNFKARLMKYRSDIFEVSSDIIQNKFIDGKFIRDNFKDKEYKKGYKDVTEEVYNIEEEEMDDESGEEEENDDDSGNEY